METLPGGDAGVRVAPAGEPASERAAEALLVARAAGRDRAAFRALVDRHRDRAYGLALRILRSAEDAEDVAQEAFVRAWLALPRFRGEAGFGTWLHRIVARRALDRLEVMKRRRGREAPVEDAEMLATVEGPAETGHARRMERLVAALPPAQRAAVTLFYYEDRSVDQVAAALGMPVNTVKTHLSRARAALREGWNRSAAEESA